MEEWFDMRVDPAQVAKERAKARELRRTNWWRAQIQKGVCHYCGGTFPPSELTMDHIVPLSRGGHSTKGNIVPCCKACNNSKKYTMPVDEILSDLDIDEPGDAEDAGVEIELPAELMRELVGDPDAVDDAVPDGTPDDSAPDA